MREKQSNLQKIYEEKSERFFLPSFLILEFIFIAFLININKTIKYINKGSRVVQIQGIGL